MDRHVGDEIDLDLELRHRLGEDKAGEVIAVRVLLQVDVVTFGRDPQRMAQDLCPGMWCWPKADDLGREDDRAVIFVMRQVIDAGLDRHVAPFSPAFLDLVQCKPGMQAVNRRRRDAASA
jgi:hypothetical protein